MTDQEAAEILAEIRKLRLLIVGNGDQNAVLPRLQALEFFTKWLKNGLKVLLSILTALIIAGLMFVIFGSP